MRAPFYILRLTYIDFIPRSFQPYSTIALSNKSRRAPQCLNSSPSPSILTHFVASMAKKGILSLASWLQLVLITSHGSKIPHHSRAPCLHGPDRILQDVRPTADTQTIEHVEV